MPRILPAILISAVLAASAAAQTPADIVAAQKALMDVNDKTPLAFGTVALVQEKAPIYGNYDPRPDNRYKSGDTIRFYGEPIGLKHKPTADGFTTGLSMDLLVKQNGTIVFGKEIFLNADFPSRHALEEVMVNGDLTLRAPAGSYDMELVMHDHNSEQIARTTLPFVIE